VVVKSLAVPRPWHRVVFICRVFQKTNTIPACLEAAATIATMSPQRGAILDCRGRVLAASEEKPRQFLLRPARLDDPKETSCELAEILDIGAHNICRVITDQRKSRLCQDKSRR